METKDVLDLRKTKAAGMGDPNKLDAVQPNCLYGYARVPFLHLCAMYSVMTHFVIR